MGILCRISALVMLLLVHLSCTFQINPIHKEHLIPDDDFDDFDVFPRVQRNTNNVCQEVPHKVLRKVLGSSYNEYYMSLDPPEAYQLRSVSETHFKRNGSTNDGPAVNRPFFFPQDLEVVLSEEPAWKVDFAVDHVQLGQGGLQTTLADGSEMGRQREKRSAPADQILDAIGQLGDRSFKWHCEAPLRWTDLGRDYFPRYILSVDCSYHGCQGPRFKCEPRSFAIKVLRKREGVCTSGFSIHRDRDTLQMGSDQMPHTLSENWIWEMRAVPFCCVCQYK